MNQKITSFILALCCGAILVSGCAKKELVKQEEPVAPPAPVVAAPQPPPLPPLPPQVTEQQAAPAPAAVKEETLQETVKPQVPEVALTPVYFDFDSFVLSAASRETLKKNAEWLQKNAALKAQVQGNCDERGSAEYNLALGEKRAKSALNYLVTLGVPADRLTFISYGKEKPLDPGHDEAAWAKNRRADFVPVK